MIRLLPRARGACLILLMVFTAGCMQQPGGGRGEGPGHREQDLGLSPEQEFALGGKVYAEILQKARVLPPNDPQVQRVREIGKRIANAVAIRPLRREINLHLEGYRFDWRFNVLQDRQVNAFCLPGGRVGVYTGILNVVQNDDQLATVLSHEIAHALAHHASERMARAQLTAPARRIADGSVEDVDVKSRDQLVSLFSASGGSFGELAHGRFQESEADHIGVFLMTFAGYDPRQAVAFWQHMHAVSARQGQPPEILSTHPSDERRIRQLQQWVPLALGGKKAYDEGRIAPEAR